MSLILSGRPFVIFGVARVSSEMVSSLVESLKNLGVKEVVCAPGGRSASLWRAFLEDEDFVTYRSFDERSAGFFALGKSFGANPVVILTTSGSALANVYPAVLEAYYQKDSKLIVLTADRPSRYRHTGAPQTMDQKHFYSKHARSFVDLEVSGKEKLELQGLPYPFHINVSLEDPVKEERQNATSFDVKNLVVLASMSLSEAQSLKQKLKNYSGLMLIEPLSNMYSKDFPKATILKHPEAVLKKTSLENLYRFGGVPVTSYWRRLRPETKVFYSDRELFSGSPEAVKMKEDAMITKLLSETDDLAFVAQLDQKQEVKFQKALSVCEHAEIPQLKKLVEKIPEKSQVFLGNSLVVRNWAYLFEGFKFSYIGQRGLNGIDGSLALALGQAQKGVENWIVLGDLTALYNFNDAHLLKYIASETKLRLVVINNSGGQIFSRIFKEKTSEFVNAQDFDFKNMARSWKMDHQVFESEVLKTSNRLLLEVKVDPEQTLDFWKVYES